MPKKVLVVDDDPDVRLINRTVIEENGYTALIAEDGEQGLQIIKKEAPDLVLLDVLMPKQSGLRLYSQLKTNKSLEKIPVVILSGIAKRTFLRSQKALVEFGGDKVPEPEIYLEKPVESDELAKVIKDILG
jgi:twitching motility two-component system response regulator PilH